MTELLTVREVAALLRLSRWQVYELTKGRTRTGEVRDNPLPTIRIGAAVRFSRDKVEAWINDQGRTGS